MPQEKLKFKGLWKDDKGRLVEICQENQYGWIGYCLIKPKDQQQYIRATKFMYDFNGVNKMDESKLMERVREARGDYPSIKEKK